MVFFIPRPTFPRFPHVPRSATPATFAAPPAAVPIPPRWHGVIVPANMPSMTQEQWEAEVRALASRFGIIARPASRFPSAYKRYLYAAATVPGWRTAFLPLNSPEYQAYCAGKLRTVFVSRRERTIVCTCALALQERKLCGHVGAVLVALLREEAAG